MPHPVIPLSQILRIDVEKKALLAHYSSSDGSEIYLRNSWILCVFLLMKTFERMGDYLLPDIQTATYTIKEHLTREEESSDSLFRQSLVPSPIAHAHPAVAIR